MDILANRFFLTDACYIMLQRKGLYPAPPGESDILGLEAAGIIDKLGPGCVGNWKTGDRVMVLVPGMF